MTSNTLDVKYRTRFLNNYTFQCFSTMQFGFGGQMQRNENITYPLLNIFRPEKMIFAFTNERSSSDNMHKLKPFMGL